MDLIFEAACRNNLTRAEIELDLERANITAMLHECQRDHVSPGKDYWHKLDRLERKVAAYRAIIGIIS